MMRACIYDGFRRQQAAVAGPGLPRSHPATPDGQWDLLRLDHDIALRDVASGRIRRLTQDGTADCAYAVSPDTDLQTVTRRVQGLASPPLATARTRQ